MRNEAKNERGIASRAWAVLTGRDWMQTRTPESVVAEAERVVRERDEARSQVAALGHVVADQLAYPVGHGAGADYRRARERVARVLADFVSAVKEHDERLRMEGRASAVAELRARGWGGSALGPDMDAVGRGSLPCAEPDRELLREVVNAAWDAPDTYERAATADAIINAVLAARKTER